MTYTLEVYRYNTDRHPQMTVHAGTFEDVRDELSPCMIRTREYMADSIEEAISKANALAEHLTANGEPHTFVTPEKP